MRSFFVAAAALAVVACSESSSSGPGKHSLPNTAGIALDADGGPKALSDLCPNEQQKLCDWTAAEGGGYGAKVVCEAGTVSEYPDQATCLASFPAGCSTATVADWEACRLAEAQDPCATLGTLPDECTPLAACAGKTDASAFAGSLDCEDGGAAADGSTE